MAVVAGLAEFVGGILVAVGFLTPLATLALFATMVVAVLMVHLKNGFFSVNGGYEFNLMLALVLAGAFSLDGVLGTPAWRASWLYSRRRLWERRGNRPPPPSR
jgi:putative oxidoreductase